MELTLTLPVIWVIIGIALIIIETAILSLDFLALGIAALITAAVISIEPSRQTRLIAVIIFAIASTINLFITKRYMRPNMTKHSTDPMTTDQIIGHQATVTIVNQKKVIQYQGNYRPIKNHAECQKDDQIIITACKNNTVTIKQAKKK